jgi:hypothetical protein
VSLYRIPLLSSGLNEFALTTSFSSVRFYYRLSPRSVSLSCFRFSCHDASPDLRLRAVISCASLIACWIFGVYLFFSKAENAFALLAAMKKSVESRERNRKASWWLSSVANQIPSNMVHLDETVVVTLLGLLHELCGIF